MFVVLVNTSAIDFHEINQSLITLARKPQSVLKHKIPVQEQEIPRGTAAALDVEPKAEDKVMEGSCFIVEVKDMTTLASALPVLVLKPRMLATALQVTGTGSKNPEWGDTTRIGVGFKICFVVKPSEEGNLVDMGAVAVKGASVLDAFKVELDPLLASVIIA